MDAPDETSAAGVRHRMGLSLLLDQRFAVDRVLMSLGTWEADQVSRLLALSAEAMGNAAGPRVFLDVGAYFGLYALLMDRERMFDRIIAFEPDRLNFAQLQAQLFLNDAAYRIEARNEAAGESQSIQQMYRSDRHPDGNRGGVGVWHCAADPRCIPVSVFRIDDLGLSDGLVVAKIDVEGYQEFVLRGMRDTIARNVCVLQVEALEPQRDATLALAEELRLRECGAVGPDFYFKTPNK